VTQRPDLSAPSREARRAQRRDMVLVAATLGFGVINLDVIAGLSVTGVGIGLVVTAITAALLGSVAPAQSGIASGAFTAFRQTGSVLGVALFGTLLAGLRPSTGLEATFAIGAGLVAVVAALGHAAR